MKGYGIRSKVCYKHRSIIGGAVVRFGNCENCNEKVSSGVGSPPKLCGKCSVFLSECSYCRVKLDGK